MAHGIEWRLLHRKQESRLSQRNFLKIQRVSAHFSAAFCAEIFWKSAHFSAFLTQFFSTRVLLDFDKIW